MEIIIKKDDYTFLKFIEFKNITLWDVKRYYKIIDYNFSEKLGDYLKLYRRELSEKEIYEEKIQIISKINFHGELFLRNFNEIESYKGKLYAVPPNTIIYSKINVRHGCIYFNSTGKTIAVSNEYPVFTFDKKLINGEFIPFMMRTTKMKQILNTKNTGISKSRIKVDEILNTYFPLPDIDCQENILQNYYQKIQLAESQAYQADELEKGIDEYLFEELGVKLIEGRGSKFQLSFIKYSKLNRWGVAFINNSNTADKLLISKKYPIEQLIKYVEINPPTSFANSEVTEISFLPMECISDEFGEVKEYYEGKKENSNGYTKFIEGDLLWSKITPCMQNGKSAIVKNLKNGLGYGSTEYHVLRQNSENINLEFVYHILRSKYILKQGTYHFTGSAGQQRVPADFLKELYIPFPPHEKQKEISEQIKTWKTQIKALREQANLNRVNAIKEFEEEIFSAV